VRLASLALVAVLVTSARSLAAQVGSTTDILNGVVTDADHNPIEGATVEATSVETQITRHIVTNAKGRYTILFPDGGGQYRVTVRALGEAEQRFVLARQADEDRLTRNVIMSPTAVVLEQVTVRARQRGGGRDRATPGSTERNIGGEQAAHLPVDASDPNALAALAPGVVSIAGTDTTAAAFSVAGQAPTLNNVTLDGLSFGGGSVPQDAVRSTRVITSTYDVARGQFTGGVVASTTRGGSNIPAGSFTYALRDKSLAFGTGEASAFGQGYTQNQLGGGFGGALVRDKLFIFGAAQGRWRDEDAQSLLTADEATLERLGVAPDSAARFMALVNGYGVPVATVGGDSNRTTDGWNAIVRTDWLLAEQHTLTLRGDWRLNTQDPTRLSPLSLPTGSGTMHDQGGGLMATLTSRFGGTVINELRAYGSLDKRSSSPFLALPTARVQVTSVVTDTIQSVANLGFGGSPALPQEVDTRTLEASDEVSWLPGNASHRIKLGGLLNVSRVQQQSSIDPYGLFIFNSLEDLEANQPASFTRTLQTSQRVGTALNPAFYVGDSWRASPALQLTYGARLEGSVYRGAPANNATVDSVFGVRTDRFPSEWHASPRVGFTWTPGAGEGGPPQWIVRGGGGEFRSPAPAGLFSAAESGGVSSESQLVCVGSAVPIPDWNAYSADPSTIPTTCTDGGTGVGTTARPSITAFDPNFGAPRAWRASLGVQHRFFERYGLSIDALYARGVSLVGVNDLNLNTNPGFTLADEGNRPVYVPAASIVPASGAIDPFASRLHPELGTVFSIGSNLESEAGQFIVGLNGFTLRGLILQASYTYTRSRDQSPFTCCSASQGFASTTTAGNPNTAEWATSDYERRHQFLLTATYPFTAALELTTIARLTSGAPFTPMVGGDINGDGFRNDRAFVFDPATVAGDTALANGMRRLLATAPSGVRECLESQFGSVASRNSCTSNWQPSLDLQLNWRPALFGLQRRLMISVSTVNLLAGVDQWVHGSNDLHGWGVPARPDQTLLSVQGFDPVSNQFLYTVNERFGSASGAAAAYRVPFQIALQAHLVIGPDQARDRLRGIFGGGRGGGGGQGGGGGAPGGEGAAANANDLGGRFARGMLNPASRVLLLRDSLTLTDTQVTQLTALRDSVDKLLAPLADSVRVTLDKAGPNPDPARLFASVRPYLTKGREYVQGAVNAMQGMLTPDQWAKVGDDIKRPGPGGRQRREAPP